MIFFVNNRTAYEVNDYGVITKLNGITMTTRNVLEWLTRPLEWHFYLLAFFMIALLYLQIVISPAGLLLLLSAPAFEFLPFEQALWLSAGVGVIGLGIGIFWAESIRRAQGILTFHSYLLSTPEIDGWRDRAGNVIRR